MWYYFYDLHLSKVGQNRWLLHSVAGWGLWEADSKMEFGIQDVFHGKALGSMPCGRVEEGGKGRRRADLRAALAHPTGGCGVKMAHQSFTALG